MFEFQYPYFFLLLLLPPVIFVFFKPAGTSKTGVPAIYNPNLKWIKRAYGKGAKETKNGSQFNLNLYIVWGLLVFALAHPQKVEKITNSITKGYDIMMLVDLSESMRAYDFADINNNDRRSRLDVVKKVASEFVKGRNGDRIGLILFGDTAYLQTPLTSDLTSAISMLELSEIGMAGDATAIGDAIALGIKSLMNRPEGSRVMVLLTDGTNTSGSISPTEASKLAKEFGIKIYTIGVGKNGIVPFPANNGGIVYAKIQMDEKSLRKISEDTGGSYFLATDEYSLKDIYKKIDELEKSEAQTSEQVLRQQFYHYPLSIAMLVLIYLIIMRYNWSRLV